MHKISIKNESEIGIMAEGGKKLAEIRAKLAEAVKPGVTTGEIESLANKLIKEAGGEAAFKKVPGYHWAVCASVNDEVVHGIPGKYRIKDGDVVGIDVGLIYKGWYTDAAVTVGVGKQKENARFLETGKKALKAAVDQARVGKRVTDISKAMEKVICEAGYSPVRALTGHGVGKELHEEPAIPCFTLGEEKNSPKIEAGMTLAIEVMYNQGESEVKYKNSDGWTIATADGKISGLFEETVAVTAEGPRILTKQAN